jgi:hypothetical protein
VALANIRERLLRSASARPPRLEIVAAEPGTVARLRLPLETSTA